MMQWINYISYFSIPLFLFVLVPCIAGTFLTLGLREHCDVSIPHRWFALMVATFASPIVIVGIAFAFAGDPGEARPGATLLFDLLLTAGLACPVLLGTATLHWSDRRDAAWRSALSVACLSIFPGVLIALLGAAQILSGVSL